MSFFLKSLVQVALKKKKYLTRFPVRYKVLCFCLLLYFLWALSLLFLLSFLSGFFSLFHNSEQKCTLEPIRVPPFTGKETEGLSSVMGVTHILRVEFRLSSAHLSLLDWWRWRVMDGYRAGNCLVLYGSSCKINILEIKIEKTY